MGAITPEVTTAEEGTAAQPRRPWLVAVLGLLTVVLVVALLLLWQRERDASAEAVLQDAEGDATSAASEIAAAMTSYDHRTVDDDFAWVQEGGTAAFQETYEKSTGPIRELVVKTRAHAEGTVTEASGTADDPRHVTVLLFVDQALRHPGSKAEVDSSRVVMHMVLQDGAWLVDDVELR
jgi:Mce-associated membrane protein